MLDDGAVCPYAGIERSKRRIENAPVDSRKADVADMRDALQMEEGRIRGRFVGDGADLEGLCAERVELGPTPFAKVTDDIERAIFDFFERLHRLGITIDNLFDELLGTFNDLARR